MRRPALLLVMGSLLLSITSFFSPELLRTSASSAATEVPVTTASEAEQQEPALGDIRERSLRSGDSLSETKESLLAPSTTTTTAPCPAVTVSYTWKYDVLKEEYENRTKWVAKNDPLSSCSGCTYFGTSLWKSRVSGALNNSAFGRDALINTTCGNGNSAMGHNALTRNVTGWQNTAIGSFALNNNTTGINNTAVGYSAGRNQITGNNNVYIDNPGYNGESGTIHIGTSGTHTRIYLAGVESPLTVGGALFWGPGGQLGVLPSSRRYKEDIHDMGKASEGLQRLRPVAFRYKADAVASGGAQDYGLIAEEVAEVYPELVGRNADGEIVTVHYHKLIPMFLNEMQKQQNAIQQQRQKNAELEARLAVLESK